MTDAPLPTAEQEARAKWDLLLADNEIRLEQIRRVRQEMRLAPWQLARVRQEMRLAPWQLAIGGFSVGAAWAAVIFAIAKLL